MKSFGLLCLAAFMLALAGCETAPTSPVSPVSSATLAAPAPKSPAAPAQQSPGKVDQRPEPLVRVEPHYPFDARQAGITGNVVVEFTVTKNGDVIDAVAVSATYPAFISPALSCISRWKFTPGMKNGRPVYCRMQQTITFGL